MCPSLSLPCGEQHLQIIRVIAVRCIATKNICIAKTEISKVTGDFLKVSIPFEFILSILASSGIFLHINNVLDL